MLVKVPRLVNKLYPKRIWTAPAEGKKVYLTFDDGPIPEVTPWVLDLLAEYEARATFFCIGDNLRKHQEVYSRILSEGHSIGNHTHNHLNGWSTSPKTYLQNVLLAESYFQEPHSLFRPPYGKLTGKQASLLLEKGYRIVMWDVLSLDYNKNVSPHTCFRNVVENAAPGSIVVFHDSLKAEANLRAVLPKVLEYFHEKGFVFASLQT